MKRRKIVGLALLVGTICYLLASLLALYQNQRVKMEKGIEEALKAYSNKESMEVKELTKDFNLLLEEKLDVSDMDQQILKYEGSFARMEKYVTNVTDEMAVVDYNINYLNERMEIVENYYNALYEEVMDMDILYEGKVTELTNIITDIKEEIKTMQNDLSEIEKRLTENDVEQGKNVKMLQEQIALCEQRITDLEGNALHFEYDSGSQTLNVFGKREEINGEE